MDPVDCVWTRLRSPFPYPLKGHACKWERYDADRAGCVLCGARHRCGTSMIDCACPLAETDDGSHVCLITGLCVPEVRTSTSEYADCVVFDGERAAPSCEDDAVLERTQAVVHGFLTSGRTVSCRRQECEKGALKLKQAFWRVLRQRKRERPHELPCVCSVVAEVALAEPTVAHEPLWEAEQVVQRCAASIASCIIQIHRMGFRKACQGGKFQGMVIGMLYLCRTGLRVGELFHMPAVPGVQAFLPAETYLNALGVSNKIICDTENEIKSCIRAHLDAQKSRRPRKRAACASSAPLLPRAPSALRVRP
jgi:hypothetical protein